jgi:hypothetical protein
VGLASDLLVEWILEQRLPFNSLYFYGLDRSILAIAPSKKEHFDICAGEGTNEKDVATSTNLIKEYNEISQPHLKDCSPL